VSEQWVETHLAGDSWLEVDPAAPSSSSYKFGVQLTKSRRVVSVLGNTILLRGFFQNYNFSWIFSVFHEREAQRNCDGRGGGVGVGAQRSILSVNEPQKTDARSAQAGRVTKTQ
jgi:hypothetical protein